MNGDHAVGRKFDEVVELALPEEVASPRGAALDP